MQRQQLARKRKTRVRARFFSLFLSLLIITVIGYFFWQTTGEQIPNLHGWKSSEVLDFARYHNIEVEMDFIYTSDMMPTLVVSQSISPRTDITEGMSLRVEISKGVEVR